jgi:hypothetical protein
MADIHEVLVHCSAAVFSGALSSCLLFRHEAMVLTTHNFFLCLQRLGSAAAQVEQQQAQYCSAMDRTRDLIWHHFVRLLARIGDRTSTVEPEVPLQATFFFPLCFPQDHSHGTGNSTYIQWPKCLPFGCLLHLWKTFSLLIAHSRKAGSSGTPPILRWMLNLFPIMLSILLTFPCARWYSLHI